MSNLDVGYFNDQNLPGIYKLVPPLLLTGATLNFAKRGASKNITVCEVNFGFKSGLSPVFFDVGNSDSIGKLNCLAKAKEYSNPTFDLVGIVEGKYEDARVAEMCATEFKTRHTTNFNNEALKANIIKATPKMTAFINTCFEQDPTSFNPVVKESAEKFITKATAVYNNGGIDPERTEQPDSVTGKKKQPMTEAQAQI